MGIRAILLRARTRACAWAAVWAVLLSMVQTAPANVRLNLGDLPPENRVGVFSETFENGAGPLVAFVQYPRLENEPILAMTASGRLFWLSRDPLGEFADPLHNLYRFVGNNPLNAVDPDGRFVNMIVGAASSVGMGITIGLVTGEGYSLSDFAIDAGAGAVGAGVVSKANKLYRIARLRQLAKARGLVNLGQKGYVETWRKAGSLERLAIKYDPAKSPNVMVGSKVPRFEYRIDAGKYWDPYTGRVGAKGAISHVPLEPFTPNSSLSIGAAIGAVTLPADSDEYDAVEAAIEALILPPIDEEENKTRPCK